MFYITFESPMHKCQLKCLDNFLENNSYSSRHRKNSIFTFLVFWDDCGVSVEYLGDITCGLSL